MPRKPGAIDSEKYERARELREAGHSLTAIAKATGAAYSTVHRWTLDVRPDLARPAEHTEAIRQGRAQSVAGVAEEIDRGGCGTPGCPDHDCAITYGVCHCGCGEPAPISTMTERRRGFVRGEPHVFILGHNRRGFSPAPLSETGRRVLSETMTAKMNELHADPVRKARWAHTRHGSTRFYGRANRELAAAKGNKVGPRFTEVDVVKAEKILRLSDEKNADGKPRHSQRTIARMVGVSRSSVRNVLANREGVMAHFLIEKVG